MPSSKRQRLSDGADVSQDDDSLHNLSGGDSDASVDSDSSSSTTAGIAEAKAQKSRQTSKRKIRATGTSTFGATLQSLLETEAPSAQPLSLKPSISRKKNDEKLAQRAKKVLQIERKQKEDVGRIKDVIGGWGGESERALRKVAQRGGSVFFY
jgi:hypothetical protein